MTREWDQRTDRSAHERDHGKVGLDEDTDVVQKTAVLCDIRGLPHTCPYYAGLLAVAG